MNREVLSKYDIMTVGETSGVTIEEAQKYAGEDSGELNMVFQFEHVEDASPHAKFGKWTTDRYDFKAFKKTMIKWQEELHGTACFLEIMISREVSADLEMTIRHTERLLQKCWQPVFI